MTPDQMTPAHRLLLAIRAHRHHPAIFAAGLGNTFDALAEYIAETHARLAQLEARMGLLEGTGQVSQWASEAAQRSAYLPSKPDTVPRHPDGAMHYIAEPL